MMKRHGPSVGLLPHTRLKRHRSSVELQLPDDVLELIFERLPLKPLLTFRIVSNKWKTTIDSRRFQERQLIRRRQSRGPDVLYVSLVDNRKNDDGAASRSFVIGSSVVSTVELFNSSTVICDGSCDGLLCLSSVYEPSVVINPATRWLQSFPLCSVQQLIADRYKQKKYDTARPKLGFGKDKFNGAYKPVWLSNSSDFGLQNVTTCEVFDFTTNAWRYVRPASPCRILSYHKPVYLDGSLYWFTEGQETNVLSFDLHTETFQVICKAPFAHLLHPRDVTMCILDNCLCVSKINWPTQVIWSFDSSGRNKTWKKLCSIDLTKTFSWFGEPLCALLPVAILEKHKLLLQDPVSLNTLVIHDLHTKSYDLLFKHNRSGHCVSCFQSLFSTLSN